MTEKPYISIAQELIMEGEGLELKPYKDTVGKLTIGYGRNLDDNGITEEEAKYLLARDMIRSHNELMSEFSFFSQLDEIRQAVVADMLHNLGLPRLLTFRKMLRALQIRDYDEAAVQIRDSRYFDQFSARAKRNFCMMKFGRMYTREEAAKYFEAIKKLS